MKTWLKVERAKRDMTQAQLAQEMNVSTHAINCIENRKYMPSVILAIKLARYFGTTVEQIFFLEEDD